jgi:hypothetical protein
LFRLTLAGTKSDPDGRVLPEANFNWEKSDRETFSPDAGQRSRAIIAGDDPGDQQVPERRGFNRHLLAIAANARL